MFSRFFRRAVAAGAAVALGIGVFGAVMTLATASTASVASAAVAHHAYRTGRSGLNIRSGPGTSYARVGWLGDGASVDVSCWEMGQAVLGDPVWLSVRSGSANGYAADYYVDTHWRSTADLTSQGMPPCASTATPGTPSLPAGQPHPSGPAPSSLAPSTRPPATPTLTTTALEESGAAWAERHVGAVATNGEDPWSRTWSGECLVFVWDAFARTIPARPTAYQDYQLFQSEGRVHPGAPPRGSIVWYGGAEGYGHTAVGVGGGYIVGTHGYDGQQLPVARDYYLTRGLPYLGWSWPDR